MLGAQADWTRREEMRQRIGNVRRMLKFAWLAAQYDSAVFAAVFINAARSEGDDLIAYVKRNGRTYHVGDSTVTTMKRRRDV